VQRCRGSAEVVQRWCKCRGGAEVQKCKGTEVQRCIRGAEMQQRCRGGAEVVQVQMR